MDSPSSISDSLESVDWEFLAHTLRTMHLGVEPKDAKTRRLRAELGIIRQILYEKIRGWNGNSIDLSLFVATYKSIRKMEREFESLGIKKTEFLIFLELLLNKFGKQKLKVKKPHVTRSEFKKMKGVVEDGHDHL